MNMRAFTEEVVLIKEASEKGDANKRMWIQFAKNIAIGGAAYGIGRTSGKVLGEKILPLLGKNMDDKKLKLMARAVGAFSSIGALAMMNAMNEGQREIEKAKKG